MDQRGAWLRSPISSSILETPKRVCPRKRMLGSIEQEFGFVFSFWAGPKQDILVGE
jgi:hypothetical protein